MCLNTGTPNNHHFPFVINGKVVMLGVPILEHFRVRSLTLLEWIPILGYYVNSGDTVQMPQNAASDQGLHCLFTEISNGLIQMIRMD